MTLEDLGFKKTQGAIDGEEVWVRPLEDGTEDEFVLRRAMIDYSYQPNGEKAHLDWAMVEALHDYYIKHKDSEEEGHD